MSISFIDESFIEKNDMLNLITLQKKEQLMTVEEKTLLQKIFTLINILDVNKDATPQLNNHESLFDFFSKFIPNITNIPTQSSQLRQQLHILENRLIPTLRNVDKVGKVTPTQGFKTIFIVPLKTEIKVDNGNPIIDIQQESQNQGQTTTIETNFLRPEYSKCTIDVAYNPRKYSSNINIHETPGSYIDPGDRTANVDTFIPQENTKIDLTYYGLPGISFQAEKVDNGPNNRPTFIKITLIFTGATGSKFENIYSIEFTIDRNQKLQGDISVKFNNQSQLQFNDPNIFEGNNEKNKFIDDNYNNPANEDSKIKSFLFLLGKLLGDLMQIVYVKESSLKDTLNEFILFTNDLVVALRCVILKIPFLLSVNYKEVSKSNCNVLYFYDDITALQQFRLILGEKKAMIQREVDKIKDFILNQLSNNIYIQGYIEFLYMENNSKSNINIQDISATFFGEEEFITYTRDNVIQNVEKIKKKLEECIGEIKNFEDLIKRYEKENKSENYIKEFSELLRMFSSIKIISQYENKNSKYIFKNDNKFVSVKLHRITSNPDLTDLDEIIRNEIIQKIVNILNTCRISDNSGRNINLRTIMDSYRTMSSNLYEKIKKTLSSQQRSSRRLERKRNREPELPESMPQTIAQSMLQPPSQPQSQPIKEEPMQMIEESDTESQLAKRIRQEQTIQQSGGAKHLELTEEEEIDIITEHIYSIFYSYCNYYGITLLENGTFISYLYTLYKHDNEFELKNPKIKRIFDIEKSYIEKSTDNDYDIRETNMDVSITDPDEITKKVIMNIHETITIKMSLKDKKGKENILLKSKPFTDLKKTIKKGDRTRKKSIGMLQSISSNIFPLQSRISRQRSILAGRPDNITLKTKSDKKVEKKLVKKREKVEKEEKVKKARATVKFPKRAKKGGKKYTLKKRTNKRTKKRTNKRNKKS